MPTERVVLWLASVVKLPVSDRNVAEASASARAGEHSLVLEACDRGAIDKIASREKTAVTLEAGMAGRLIVENEVF